jgi:hypothetical protein
MSINFHYTTAILTDLGKIKKHTCCNLSILWSYRLAPRARRRAFVLERSACFFFFISRSKVESTELMVASLMALFCLLALLLDSDLTSDPLLRDVAILDFESRRSFCNLCRNDKFSVELLLREELPLLSEEEDFEADELLETSTTGGFFFFALDLFLFLSASFSCARSVRDTAFVLVLAAGLV